jgi:hypothetical protein
MMGMMVGLLMGMMLLLLRGESKRRGARSRAPTL